MSRRPLRAAACITLAFGLAACGGDDGVATLGGDRGADAASAAADGHVADGVGGEVRFGSDDGADAEAGADATGAMDTARPADAAADALPLSVLTASIDAPATGDIVPVDTPIELRGRVADSRYPLTSLTASWSSAAAGLLGSSAIGPDGAVSLTLPSLPQGPHAITLAVRNPAGQTTTATVNIGVCGWVDAATFDADLEGTDWRIFGDAYWDPGGWLEMTGNEQSRHGAIFNVADRVDAGDVAIHFRIRTGEGINTGADGFAMSVIDAPDEAALAAIVEAGQNGGCLGYGVSGPCGELQIRAFHIEFDTWPNRDWAPHGNDPTQQNHVAINLDGNPAPHPLWAEIASIEDGEWHAVDVTIDGDHVTVAIDGATVIDGTIPTLSFQGGYIGFSGTTGYATNWHSFDDLSVDQECRVK